MSSIRSQDTRLTYKTQLHFYALNNELSKNEIKIANSNGLEWVNSTPMIIISTTVGTNPSEEME